MPSTPEPSLEAPADPLPAPTASGDGAEAEPDEGSEPAEVTESIPAPEDFVRVADWIPDIYTDLRYAADNNFTGQAIYDFSDAYLRYGTVQKLAADFGISGEKPSVLAKLKRGKTQAEAERHCFRVLRDYFGILQDWKEHCAPQSPEDAIDPRYAEACHMLERIGNMLDILACGTPQERAEVVADLQKDDRLMRMEARNRQIKEDEYGTK